MRINLDLKEFSENHKVISIAIWTGMNNKILISMENTKTLNSFNNVDDAVNWLYLSGYIASARKLHQTANGV